jgi:hypothetical protein
MEKFLYYAVLAIIAIPQVIIWSLIKISNFINKNLNIKIWISNFICMIERPIVAIFSWIMSLAIIAVMLCVFPWFALILILMGLAWPSTHFDHYDEHENRYNP